MSKAAKNNRPPEEVRKVFPDVCKWFQDNGNQPTSETAESQVDERFQRYQETKASPCDSCPLCQGHE